MTLTPAMVKELAAAAAVEPVHGNGPRKVLHSRWGPCHPKAPLNGSILARSVHNRDRFPVCPPLH
jgi:hypothetical protein